LKLRDTAQGIKGRIAHRQAAKGRVPTRGSVIWIFFIWQINFRFARFPRMEISATATAPQSSKYNPTSHAPKVDYNPPPAKDGITPSREAIAAEAVAAAGDPRGRNLDIFA